MFNPGLISSRGVGGLAELHRGRRGVDLDEVEPIDPSDYNSPSIAIGKLVGTQTVTREVTAVKTGLYRTSVVCRV